MYTFTIPDAHCTIPLITSTRILIPNQHIVYLHFPLAKISTFRGIDLRDEQLMNLRRRTDRKELWASYITPHR